MMENHEAAIGQLSKQVVVMKTDIHELQEINKTVEAQLGKSVQSQTLILTQFAGKSEPTMLQI
jgi:TolA-binding protein